MKPLFYPPRLNPLLVRFVQIIAPYGARLFYKFELVIGSESLDQIKSLQHKTLLLTPNHPTFHDPIVMFVLSAKLKEKFHYLAAYELFNSWLAGFFQRLGVYSIRRGLVDRSSITETLALLSNPESRLVVFPEGGCSFQNDTVMPFRSGTVQLAFKAMEKKAKQGETIPDLYVVPVSIKYKYTQNMEKAIAQTLEELEQALNIIPESHFSSYQRLRLIAEQVIVKIEQDYGLATTETNYQSWQERIKKLRIKIIENCEQQLGILTNPNEMVRERTYKLEYVLKTKVEQLESSEVNPESNLLKTESALNLDLIDKSIKRLLNFDAIYDGYVAENPTSERFLDTLIRLEREVFNIDKPKPKGFRQAIVKIGNPVNLKDFFNDYQQERLKTVNNVVFQIQQEVQKKLDIEFLN
ncbi:phospholipid/glycerol acyltransferase [Stanieria cyanosphaera PCC 7437]|uniref:Phospholipid/glycerol acyltransferase n=1 Tax=Stanieria cyanosphaera (strain ATCC 29371 / PCC 7437) TaxID=111780 RepID=K9XU39_STAC7|nr:1-acyl-sn-glycerol-3-phosphate acyltransferase [Stanieria cyanosphaera]AFZ36110.1 phospholipid/glycerol acyltransferase [Stanieria cyanosphaera PCC 7437]